MSPAAPLSVLHLSTWDNAGGSGRAAYRLHTSLRDRGIRSRMLVGYKQTSDPDVRVIGGAFHQLDKLCGRLVDQTDRQYLFYPSSFFLPSARWVRDADVIQVFNTHGGYLSHRALGPLSRLKPVVWRLSDMWALTGHCSYSYECDRWKIGCGQCPHLLEFPALHRDTTAALWRVKQRIYKESSLVIVTPSKWLGELARQSPLLNRFPIHWIPNGLNTDLFRPMPKKEARQLLGVNSQGPILLFSCASVQQERKGAKLLQEALKLLAQERKEELTLLVAGEGASRWQMAGPFQVHGTEQTNDDRMLAAIYSAADLFVLPTLADNLPNGILESMACGTPAVSFAVGGVPEAVRHLETGYTAQPDDAQDLARGIRLLLENDELRSRLGVQCRRLIEQEYTLELQAHRFEQLYRNILSTP